MSLSCVVPNARGMFHIPINNQSNIVFSFIRYMIVNKEYVLPRGRKFKKNRLSTHIFELRYLSYHLSSGPEITHTYRLI